jgi:predicted GH43/DUF377 family glycosyl hydrolase
MGLKTFKFFQRCGKIINGFFENDEHNRELGFLLNDSVLYNHLSENDIFTIMTMDFIANDTYNITVMYKPRVMLIDLKYTFNYGGDDHITINNIT